MDHNAIDRPQQAVVSIVNAADQQNGLNGHTNYTDNSTEFSKGFCMPHLPNRDPIDIQFKDITYTVKLGFYKGMCVCYNYILLYLHNKTEKKLPKLWINFKSGW